MPENAVAERPQPKTDLDGDLPPNRTAGLAPAAGCGSGEHGAGCCRSGGRPQTNHSPGQESEHHHEHDAGGISWRFQILLPGILFFLAVAGRYWVGGRVSPAVSTGVLLLSYLLCGLPVLRQAWDKMRHGDLFNEFTLMGLASLVAIGLGEVAEAVGVMLFYSIGEAVQERASGHSRRSILALLATKPQTATVIRDGRLEVVRPEEVAVGTTVVVTPGEKVPLDGIVVAGSSLLDMSSLTGESLPVAVEPGEAVYSGAICLDGDIRLQTTAAYRDSMVGRILAMVEKAVANKSKTERFMSVFARYYTPAVTGAALLVAVVPPLVLAAPWSVWVYRALVLLVISCPCALLLSVPLAFFAGIGSASRQGILVKGGQVFDALARARQVIFDKTGTLTEGSLSLKEIQPAAGVAPDEVLALAARAESRSTHPVAQAVVRAHGDTERLHVDLTTRNLAGKGVIAHSDSGTTVVGNATLLAEAGVTVPAATGSDLVTYVAHNGKYQGCLLFTDRLKPGAAEAVARLRRVARLQGVYLLTGDRPEAAAAVATALDLDGYRAGLLPDGKVAAFAELSPTGDAVFVGDGINDAPVLAAAGVGVAMGALGSAAAVEAADAVILDDAPEKLPALFEIARRTRRIAGENIALSLVVKAVIMVLGVLGLSGLWGAVFADVGVALVAVCNSMRLVRR
ncbi:MAG: cadmium-translocating P-type ATPase [Planctomycetes bacterium]|nr:cadmium-translocating P-type ATPase [Planctomycetota bacterium]